MMIRVLTLAFICFLILPIASCDAGEVKKSYDLPDFKVAGLNKTDISTGTVILNLFASWCGPCLAEHPVITQLSKKIPVYGIALMDQPEAVAAYLKKNGNPYRRVGIDKDGSSIPVFQAPGVPITYVLHNGKVIYENNGPVTFVQKAEILKLVAKQQ